MPPADEIHAQLVMKREDGGSILDSGQSAISENVGLTGLPEDRIARIRERVEALGFVVSAQDSNTLSISGARELFDNVFAMKPGSAEEAGMDLHAGGIPAELSDFVADVFVTKGPDFFP